MIATRRNLRRRAGQLLLAAVLLAGLAACSKTPAQLAIDELNAGLAASAAGQTDQAQAHYMACLKHDSLNQFCIYNLGVIAQQAGRAAEAENNYRLAILIDSGFESAWSNLGILRAQAGSNDEAITIFRQVIKINSKNAFAHLNLGLLLRAKGELVEAQKELATAVALDPTIVVPTFEPSPTLTPHEASPSSSPSP
jgi:tetratricopeptide (TPR) repeat protein